MPDAPSMPGHEAVSAMEVAGALRSRHSVRQFLPIAVAPSLLREVLKIASNAPSGSNLQPWLPKPCWTSFKGGSAHRTACCQFA